MNQLTMHHILYFLECFWVTFLFCFSVLMSTANPDIVLPISLECNSCSYPTNNRFCYFSQSSPNTYRWHINRGCHTCNLDTLFLELHRAKRRIELDDKNSHMYFYPTDSSRIFLESLNRFKINKFIHKADDLV